MQQSLSQRPDVDGEAFKVTLARTEMSPSADMNTARLHATLDAAKQAQWSQLQDILFDGGLMPEWLVNSVPHPRDYGILHQLAYHGASDVFLSLIEQGAVFNTALLTKGGETATKIALTRGHTGFAEIMTSMANRDSNSAATAMVGSLACQLNGKGSFLEEIRVELSAVGMLKVRVAALDERTGDLTRPGTTVQLPKTAHRRRPFCLQVTSVSPPWQFVFDTGTAIEHQRWETALQRFAPPENATSFQMYTFSVSLCDQQVHQFTLRHRIAKDINAEMVERGCKGLDFPDRWADKFSVDVTRREKELTAYLQQVFDREDALSVFANRMGFDPNELQAQRCRVSDKVRQDPDLVRRAILYLRVTGEVLYHEYENVSVIRDRVFLEPQRLVDVMKELVHHDLQGQLQQIKPAMVSEIQKLGYTIDAEEIQRLGQTFVTEGKLQRSLLPWLWRRQPQVVHNPEEMDFLIDLLTQLGLLTRVPESDPPQWILPIRLPDRDRATADAQNTFGNFLKQMEAGSAGNAVSLHEAVELIGRAGVTLDDDSRLTSEELATGCKLAFEKADEMLNGNSTDANNLTRDEIAAVNLYTQEFRRNTDAKRNIYQPLNKALRGQIRSSITPFWAYIKLLQQALLKIPQADVVVLYRGLSSIHSARALESWEKQREDAFAEVWWAFSSTSTSRNVAEDFAKGAGDVLFSINSSNARDIEQYSSFPQENELLMPCGTAFVVKAAESNKKTHVIEVSLKQSQAVLLEKENEEAALQLHQNQALAKLHQSLACSDIDFVGRRFDFHQPLPPGLFAIVISRCASLCDERTSIWRRDLITIMRASLSDSTATLQSLTILEMAHHAEQLGVNQIDLRRAGDSKERIAQLIMTVLQIEVTIRQEGLSRVTISARCHAGGHFAMLREKVRRFEAKLAGVLAEQWKGCSTSVMCLRSNGRSIPLIQCQHAVARGETSVVLGDDVVPLVSLGFKLDGSSIKELIAEGVPPSREWEPEPELETDDE